MKPEIPDAHYYRGEHCNWMADEGEVFSSDGMERWILQGWVPPKPFITKNHTIICFGSCDAEKAVWYLESHGYKVGNTKNKVVQHGPYAHVTNHGDGMASVFTVLQQFEWSWENKTFDEDVWYYSKREEAASKDNEIKKETKALFDQTDVFFILLGLSEIWYDTLTNDIFWRAVPEHKFKPERHAFRVASCQETINAINKIINMIRQYRPNATIIFGVSPTGLTATFRNVSCITADSASKAILRASIDEVIRNKEDSNLFYWPLYELFREGLRNPYLPDRRHVRPEHLDKIWNLFAKYYLV